MRLRNRIPKKSNYKEVKMRVLEGLKPEKVFYYFEEISKIPRCSGKEKQISDYLYNFAKSRNLEVIQDEHLNVIIKKPASRGYEIAQLGLSYI
jgi:dipeptidase D